MTPVSEDNKAIARAVISAFGGSPQIHRFWDESKIGSVDIVECPDRPEAGVSSFGTIGVSDTPNQAEPGGKDTRIELLGACSAPTSGFDNVLSMAAFSVINTRRFCAPGVIFPNIVAMYGLSQTMKHLMFVQPFLWDGALTTLELETKQVAWLLAVPISEAEYAMAKDQGSDALEEQFELQQIDLFDLNRPCVASAG